VNWLHIKALLKGTGSFKWFTFDGRTLVTNGFIAVVKGDMDLPLKGESYPPLGKLWKGYMTQLGEDAKVGALSKIGMQHLRQISDELIDEAAYRCFPSAKWIQGPKRSLIASVDGALVAIVMPTGHTKPGPSELGIIPDSEVFARFCSELNDWYLITNEEIESQISQLRYTLEENEQKITTAEKEIENATREIESLEQLRRARNLTVERSASPATADTR
jgi:hypothetical protein